MDRELKPAELYVLSDALGMELFIGNTNQIDGKTQRTVEFSDIGLKMNQQPKVVSSRVAGLNHEDGPDIALIVHVHGDLFLCLLHDRTGTGQLLCRVLDQSKIVDKLPSMFEDHPKASLTTIMKLMNKGIVAEFSRDPYAEKWHELKQAA